VRLASCAGALVAKVDIPFAAINVLFDLFIFGWQL
jgi:hypothetical protein